MMSTPASPEDPKKRLVGRGTSLNILNRFERVHVAPDFSDNEFDGEEESARRKVATEYFIDATGSVVSENNSSDLPFRYSINPYRGCAHGCSYCYARPWHEYLGLSAGLDFETKIIVKPDAPQLFRKWLARPSYVCEPVNLSGVTDPYQPAERKFRITRGCLQVAMDCRQPMYLITKNAMVTRDLELLGDLADQGLVRVVFSVTSHDQSLIRVMEPQTSSPAARLRAIEELSRRGIPVAVNVAPIIPGLNDHEVPEILRAAAGSGALAASYTVLRLDGAVKTVFLDWLQRHFPDRRDKIMDRVRALHDGNLHDRRMGKRMRGTGVWAEAIRTTFKTFSRRYGLDNRLEPVRTDLFMRPSLTSTADPQQLRLF